MPSTTESPIGEPTIAVPAEQLLERSLAVTTRAEHRQQQRLGAIVADPVLRELTFALTDEVLRFADSRRAAQRFRAIVSDVGVPGSLGLMDRWSLRVAAAAAGLVPSLVMPLVRRRLVHESHGVVLSADDPAFANHIERRAEQGMRVNVNVLGEAILSDAEADARMTSLLQRIARPDVHYVSLKISAVCANLDVLAFEHSVERISERLRTLYRAAAVSQPPTFVNLDMPTFVNLDMEEYRDLSLTIAALRRVLDEDEFAAIDAGVVLQAYLPDSHAAAHELCAWAVDRHERFGGRLKIRVVKGANLAMERVDSELHGWTQAPYDTKDEVDASFKLLIETLLNERYATAIRVGVASHNLFDLAWALSLGHRDRIDIEMLEGMAPAQARVVRDVAGDLLLYAPVVERHDLPASIAYLTRRLDENTSPENFLRSMFDLTPGSEAWHEQQHRFDRALAGRHDVSTSSKRRQDRSTDDLLADVTRFRNAADTDWTRAANRQWIGQHLASCDGAGTVFEPIVMVDSIEQIDLVVQQAANAAVRWSSSSFDERRSILRRAAAVMEQQRGQTLAAMAHHAVKTIAEGDPEVSEAIDFARYYASSLDSIEQLASTGGGTFRPLGVVVVASPWNFPYAIPAGGVLAALAAGNAVVLKPAPEVQRVGRLLAEQLWQAGVPTDVLQFVSCPDDHVGRRLVTHPDIATVVLTGAYQTAQMFLDWKPTMRLLAETSGKNAMIITAAADQDAAIRDLVRSAFGHAGQKCSAASLAIVEASVYDDPRFRQRLADAVRSLRIGPATDLSTMMTPLIGAPSATLQRALTSLDPGEQWLVEPGCRDANTSLWSPGVRLGVRPGSWFHNTECFGPVLGIIRADDLDHAIAIQNSGDLGLTGGIQSLDEHEVQRWLERVEIGNAYVNRHMTGAIVQRQPFGGWKHSSVGCGPKAGGPAYVEAFGTWTAVTPRGDPDAQSEFELAWRNVFTGEHDPSGLRCERNVLRYRPLRRVGLLVGDGVDPRDVAVARVAAQVAGVEIVDVVCATDPAVLTSGRSVDRLRVLGDIDDDIRRGWHREGIDLDSSPVVAIAEVELRRWVREQAISWTRHRHGRLLL